MDRRADIQRPTGFSFLTQAIAAPTAVETTTNATINDHGIMSSIPVQNFVRPLTAHQPFGC